MIYGCIGEHLSHSFSKEIHNMLADYDYRIREVTRCELEDFATAHDFLGINVTIPYKEMIMPYLYEIDEAAAAIGAVNTVVNRDGRLYGYNTDFYGMTQLIRHAGVTIAGKKVAILGGGGTSKTANAVVRALGAGEIIRVSRTSGNDVVTYDELYESHTDTEIIINTTPVGMYPETSGMPVDIERFPALSGIIDAIYNPLRSRLVSAGIARGIASSGGLYMLVAQAVRASEIFLDKKYDDGVCDRVYEKILSEKENIVLIGMPASGKTTVGKILAEELSRELIDTDRVITDMSGCTITEIFEKRGEPAFRAIESDAVRSVSKRTSVIIATGGGAVLKPENVWALRQNGRLYFIDRPLDSLVPTSDRPTASDKEKIAKRYRERYEIYCAAADEIIDASCDAKGVAKRIKESFCK